MDKIKIKLTQPIEAHGEEVTEIELSKPNGSVIRKLGGYPVRFNPDGGYEFDTAASAKYIEVLANIPASSVDSLSSKDFLAINMELAFFF